jgi:hypothetical protein
MRSIFIATPSYGVPASAYYASLLATIPALEQAGYQVQWQEWQLCCYVHTARNRLAAQFLASGKDDLLFIDNDLGWSAEEMVRLCGYDVDIVGAAAPFRHGPEGFPAHPASDRAGRLWMDAATGLLEVDVLPTAIMKISKNTLIELAHAKLAPLRIEYVRDGKEHARYLSFFDFEADDVNHVEYGEDVTFCRKCQKIGKKLLVDPNMTISHFGPSFRTGKLWQHIGPAKEPDATNTIISAQLGVASA